MQYLFEASGKIILLKNLMVLQDFFNIFIFWACSSVAERCSHEAEVGGSIPPTPNWKDFFSSLYKSQKEFFIRSGYGSIRSLQYRIKKIKDIKEKFKPQGRVLDIGCGIGNFVSLFEENYFGLDFSFAALKELKEKYKKPVAVADSQSIPFKSGVFSFVLAVEVSQYMYDHKAFISEISRILKKNGIAVIISPNPDSIFWIIRQKIKGKSPLHFISLDHLLSLGENFLLEEIQGVFPIPFLWDFVDKILNFFPRTLRKAFIMLFSKSFVLVLKRK